MSIAAFLLPLALAAPPQCTWKSEATGTTFDLSPLAGQQSISFGSSLQSLFSGTSLMPFASMGAGLQQIAVSLCGTGNSRANAGSCNGESVPAILIERAASRPAEDDDPFAILFGGALRPAPTSAAQPPRCTVLGRLPSSGKPQIALLDSSDPDAGLVVQFPKGDVCREGQRYSLIVLLHCDLDAIGHTKQMPAQVQARGRCEFVVSFTTAAACPINVGERCAPNCPKTWLGDGECDPSCDTAACDHDGGDCANRPPSGGTSLASPASVGSCAPGCQASWRGDKECDVCCRRCRSNSEPPLDAVLPC